MITRRDFLYSCLLAAASTKVLGASAFAKQRMPLIIFLEFKGGNDFLNTIVPYSNKDYIKLRPTLHLKKNEILPINQDLGFHHSLELFAELYKNKELAVVQGIGYPNQSFSHFRSLDIWETGTDGSEYLYEGWATRALSQISPGDRFVDAIGLGVTGAGPAKGMKKRSFILENPERFLSNFELQKILNEKNPSDALSHIQSIQENINETFNRMKSLPSMKDINFSGEPFLVTVRVIQKILSGIPNLPYLKFTHEGYDTHSNQKLTHDKLMNELNTGLTDLVKFLKASNLWNDTLIVTYSEFGRTPAENFSGGTDHGSSSCQFVMGGRVRGGLFGEYPSFENIKDFQFTRPLDYRTFFTSIIEDFWHVDATKVFGKKFERLKLIKG